MGHLGVISKTIVLKARQGFIGAFAVVLAYADAGIADLPAQERLPIIRHNVELHSCPASACRVVTRLPILSSVYVLDMANEEDGKEENWTNVVTEASRHTGWIIDSHIGYPHAFVPVRSWRVESFGYCMGEYCPDFRFTAAGHFTVMFPACFDGLCSDPPSEAECPPHTEKRVVDDWVHCISRGRLYRAGDVIRAGGTDSREFLYFDERGQLCADPYTC